MRRVRVTPARRSVVDPVARESIDVDKPTTGTSSAPTPSDLSGEAVPSHQPGAVSLAHMAMLYGPRTEQELDAALASFHKRRDEYRRRFEEDDIPLTQEEAVEAYKLMAPLHPGEMDPETAALQAVWNAICFPCFQTDTLGFRGRAVKAILEGFERTIAEGSQTLHIQYDGEAQPRAVDPWDRFVAYKALEYFVEFKALEPFVEVLSDYRSRLRIIDEPPRAFERAKSILAKLTVTRPRGRHDARLTLRRNGYINTMLLALEGCGLPVTSGAGGSLAGALAEALGERERTIRKVWAESPARESQFNDAMPAGHRLPGSVIRRPREYFAVGLRCAGCGRAGRVPKFRAGEGGSRLCLSCRPASGECV